MYATFTNPSGTIQNLDSGLWIGLWSGL